MSGERLGKRQNSLTGSPLYPLSPLGPYRAKAFINVSESHIAVFKPTDSTYLLTGDSISSLKCRKTELL